MLKYILPFAFFGLIVSCSSDEKPTKDTKKTDEVVKEDDGKVYDPSSVISRTEEFFDWYFENSRMLYKMRSSCIGAENGYHALDKKKLKAYTDWLKETKFFSTSFIDAEHTRWTTECAEEMREKARKKQHFEGPPPCVFEGDIFLSIQEQPTPEMRKALSFKVTDQSDSSAVVNYNGASSLTWEKSGGSWKIAVWPN
jgi:hypothetical protein